MRSDDSTDGCVNSDTSREQTPLIINECQQTPLIMSSCAARSVSRERTVVIVPSVEVQQLQAEIHELEEKETELKIKLEDLAKTCHRKSAPLEDERKRTAEHKQHLSELLAMKSAPSLYPPAPGPSALKFVEGTWFSAACNLVVVLNLLCMALKGKLQAYHTTLYALDQLFLVWYVLEFALKWYYHRCDLFWGNFWVVWWNWLDAGIVLGGVVDQWVMLLVRNLLPFDLPANFTGMRVLRLLRLFRIMRFLKVARALIQGDMSWTEGAKFHMFMSGVIAVNSIVLGLELDIEWSGWTWFEHTFLIIYSFELFVRLKFYGFHFFVNSDFVWNNLDFFMVSGGVFELWLMPAWSLIQYELFKQKHAHKNSVASFLKMMRMVRIARVLRLVRLLRMVKPLYCLLVGVMEALAAMQWVLVLAMLVLYAGAIVFTSLIGHGLIYTNQNDIPPEAEISFGSVPASFFSLFKLMNGDTDTVEPITTNTKGMLLFAGFMVLSNWAVLAILTSVVSDNMITSSQKLVREEREKDEQERLDERKAYMTRLFQQIDANKGGNIIKSEWDAMLADSSLRDELSHASGLDENTLRDVFSCLCEEHADMGEYLCYEDFITYLNHDKDVADRRQVLHLSHLMKELEKTTLKRMDQVESRTQERFEVLEDMVQRVTMAGSQRNPVELPTGHPVPAGLEQADRSRLVKLEEATQHQYKVLEGMLERVMLKISDTQREKSRSHGPAVSSDMVEMTNRHRFDVLEGKLEKVIVAMNGMNHSQGPPVPNDVERTTLSRIDKLEDATQHKFEILEGMLKTLTHAVSQKKHLEEPLRL